MTKVSLTAFLKVSLLAAMLFIVSGLISRQEVQVPLYDNDHAGGVAFITEKEGFPINYISDTNVTDYSNNPNNSDGYSIAWTMLLVNGIIWLAVSFAMYNLFSRMVAKK